MTSKVAQMKAFVVSHKGESFTASRLARELGWSKRKTKKIKGEDGKYVEDVVKISYNSKAAVRLAKKCGALVIREAAKDKETPHFVIEM